MSDKNKILESWIMVEHLSEGDINLNDKAVLMFEAPEGNDYHSMLKNTMANSRKCRDKNSGAALYFDVFKFSEVVTWLRKQFSLPNTNEDIKLGTKFSFVLYFDRELSFLKDMTFFTVSAYIRYNKKIPYEDEFREFEETLKKQLEQDLDESENDAERFNAAILGLMERFNIDAKNCRLMLLENIESASSSLHSFFIDDLEMAKSISTPNLDAYLFGNTEGRVDLDSRRDSANFNPSAFEDILQPDNYPLGRFPGKTKNALSLMQQAAVNIAAGYDDKTIRSVNGPPGTGKTTLLKDIFADLIVKQAYDMAAMSDRTIVGTKETVYYNNASIGVLPECIAENGIIVASSNNGAVQNIVNELPLIEGQIDEALLDELMEADYFRRIANSNVKSEWKKDSSGKKHEDISVEPIGGKEKFWGLFSLEGGKSDNLNNILVRVKAVEKYLKDEYVSDSDVYDEFLRQYNAVKELRSKKQRIAADYCKYHKPIYERFRQLNAKVLGSHKLREQQYDKQIREMNTALEKTNKKLRESDALLSEYSSQAKELDTLLKMYDAQMSSFPNSETFAGSDNELRDGGLADFVRKERDSVISDISQLKEKTELQHSLNKELHDKAKDCSEKLTALQQEHKAWKASAEKELADLEQKKKELGFEEKIRQINALDMTQDYDKLHLSNPWFDEEYRIAQSKLFILALKVRKQFLFENRKNVKAAAMIWGKQRKYIENKQVIVAAWNWINLTIPIISSTFASFSRMCSNLGVNTLGHLFVDEAGQAVPQASVGAIFRSKHVMVVGDPSQIKPVLTMDASVISLLSKHFGVTEKYLSDSASTQTLVDSASKFGFYREQDKSEDSWIGIPLWVHRRCLYPMFTISNHISYSGFMVQGKLRNGKDEFGKTGWFDVGGKAKEKYVEEQGEFLLRKIQQMIDKDPNIVNTKVKDTIYVISPFSNVAYQLARKLRSIGFTRYDKNGKPTNVGTIHTFQGKEAPVVFMVLGADTDSRGAAIWAVSEPNMMNVAATRAKQEFYVIGDRKLYLGLGSDVASDTFNIITEYREQHPELVDDDVKSVMDVNVPKKENDTPVPKENKDSFVSNENKTAPTSNEKNYSSVSDEKTTGSVPDQKTAEANARIKGKITFVGNGRKTKYAYVAGIDGKNYTVNETIYSQTENAETVIQKDKTVYFVPETKNDRTFATDIKPV